MSKVIAITVLVLGLFLVSDSSPLIGQSLKDQNAKLLKKYFSPYSVSKLEWELLQFNVLWQGSLLGDVNYVTSFPVSFDYKAMRFRATFGLQEKRTHDDPSPFFGLPRAQRESILQGAIDTLLELLSPSFPEVKNIPGLVYAELWFRSKGGGKSIVARYENGKLTLAE